MIREALQGIADFFLNGKNVVVYTYTFFTFIILILSLYFRVSILEWIAVFFAIGLVFSAEMFNTVVEKILDYVSLERKEEIRRIKDLSAGASLVCGIIAVIVGLLIFVPKILHIVI